MAYDEGLAQCVRQVLGERPELEEKKMFGGLAFLIDGNMACGIAGDDLMVRVGPEAYDEALTLPGAREMDFTGRPLTGFVYVAADAVADDAALTEWVERGLSVAASLPPK